MGRVLDTTQALVCVLRRVETYNLTELQDERGAQLVYLLRALHLQPVM